MAKNLSAHQKTEQAFHDRWAQKIDIRSIKVESSFECLAALENRFAFESLGNVEGKRILDLGCGNGEAAVYFAKKGARAVAIDISTACLENVKRLAAQNGVSIETQYAAVEKIPFENASFDGIFGLGVLHHFENLDDAISEIHRVLKPGGRAAFIEPLSHNPLIHAYRFLARDVRTPTEKPLSWNKMMGLGNRFASFEHREFWFLSLFIFLKFFFVERANPSKVRYWKKVLEESDRHEVLLKKLRAWDENFLLRFPYFNRHCWNTVLVFQK